MEIIINPGDSIPAGKYELTGREKLENAKGNLSYGCSDRDLLLEYDRIAGQLKREGQILPPRSIWQLEKKHEGRPIEEFSDEELQVVMRRAEDTHVSGSLYQKSSNEWKLRQDKRMFDATRRRKWCSDNVPAGYPTSCNSDQLREVIQDLLEEKQSKLQGGKFNRTWEKIIDGYIENGQKELQQRQGGRLWYEKPLGLILIGVIITIIGGYILFRLEWI